MDAFDLTENGGCIPEPARNRIMRRVADHDWRSEATAVDMQQRFLPEDPDEEAIALTRRRVRKRQEG